MRHAPTSIALALCAITLTGCLGSPDFTEQRPYPEATTRLEPSNIQLYRSGKTVSLSNTTARKFGPSTIWLNQWFRREIDGFDIGETLSFPLSDFTDEYGDEFRGGGFFAAVEPDRIVLAELETDVPVSAEHPNGQALVPLIVVGERDD